ncbi:LmbE family N-acetylglucosaminyl deacetylase [Actinomycetospora succinea]|uniref:LmbE family N-acetylglucosaminyl deacetylase n=1 Tax=Actinomycetospora succinea TaxID=663603 RepID=A0A4R6VMX8_9PSEU|nr:PIG-L family deacetylase [Actinomycetospora succinea]TDQ63311.1 LmbE family N-acetylglucosaminyl deacetylase [Actinomycetospora succinea]
MSPSLKGAGTSEDAWWGPGGLGAVPSREPAVIRPPGRVVVVAPHPDDEVLGVGGTLAVWAAEGTEVAVVAVTDGEGSHPDSPTLTPRALVDRRAEERRAALAALGIEAAVDRLRLPDGAVAADDVADGVAAILRPDDTVVAPVLGDGHPDHDATAAGAGTAAERVGVACWRYAVWLWHWAQPGDVSFDGARRVRLPATAVNAKAAAIEHFTTQVAPLSDDPRDAAVLTPPVLARFRRDTEILWGPR